MTLHNYLNLFWNFLNKIDRCIASILCFIIKKIRPLLGPEDVCPFAIGCTNFAIFNLEQQPVLLALWQIIKRLLICNPIGLLIMKKYSKK